MRRAPGYDLTARNQAFDRQIGSTKRGDRSKDCRQPWEAYGGGDGVMAKKRIYTIKEMQATNINWLESNELEVEHWNLRDAIMAQRGGAGEKSIEYIVGNLAEGHAMKVKDSFMRREMRLAGSCKSPIERALAAAMLFAQEWIPYPHVEMFIQGMTWSHDIQFEKDGVYIFPQSRVGRYIADFLIFMQDDEARKFIVVECDGHDFHEKTKHQAAQDKKRDRWMIGKGITVLRFTGSEIWANPASCAYQVFDIIDSFFGIEADEAAGTAP